MKFDVNELFAYFMQHVNLVPPERQFSFLRGARHLVPVLSASQVHALCDVAISILQNSQEQRSRPRRIALSDLLYICLYHPLAAAERGLLKHTFLRAFAAENERSRYVRAEGLSAISMYAVAAVACAGASPAHAHAAAVLVAETDKIWTDRSWTCLEKSSASNDDERYAAGLGAAAARVGVPRLKATLVEYLQRKHPRYTIGQLRAIMMYLSQPFAELTPVICQEVERRIFPATPAPAPASAPTASTKEAATLAAIKTRYLLLRDPSAAFAAAAADLAAPEGSLDLKWAWVDALQEFGLKQREAAPTTSVLAYQAAVRVLDEYLETPSAKHFYLLAAQHPCLHHKLALIANAACEQPEGMLGLSDYDFDIYVACCRVACVLAGGQDEPVVDPALTLEAAVVVAGARREQRP